MTKIFILLKEADIYGFVKQIAAEKYNIDTNRIKIEKGEHGKPYLENLTDFHFNISHSGDILVLAISDSTVGVDVEKMRTPDLRVLKRLCADEQAFIGDSPIRFFEVWTKKEAYLKYLGTGLSGGLNSFSVFNTKKQIKTLDIDNYIISLCGDCNFEIIDLR